MCGTSSFEVLPDKNLLTHVLTSAKLDATTQRWKAVDDVVANRGNFAKMNSQVVHIIFQKTGIPYGYVQTVSKSAKVVTKSNFEESESLNLDNWKVEQGRDPTLHFLI